MKITSLPLFAITLDVMIRIWGKVDRITVPGCYLWTGSTCGSSKNKSPQVYVAGRKYYVTRIVYAWHHKIDPGQLYVCHNCSPNPDNSCCINPSHLWLGSQIENMLDASNKGTVIMEGSSNPTAKLSDADILEIRCLYQSGQYTQVELAYQFGISKGHVCEIVHYKKRN